MSAPIDSGNLAELLEAMRVETERAVELPEHIPADAIAALRGSMAAIRTALDSLPAGTPPPVVPAEGGWAAVVLFRAQIDAILAGRETRVLN